VYLYRAELALRLGNDELAQSSLTAAKSLELSDEESAAIADELTHVTELVRQK
jgi:phage shock protein A